MDPFPFERLPVELKIKIIRLAIPSVITPIGTSMADRFTLEDDKELSRIRDSCPEIKQADLPIRRIVCRLLGPPLSRGAPGLQTGKVLPENGEQTYAQMPFEYSSPICSRTPMLKAFTLVIDACERGWHIEGFQQYGPNTISRRPPNNLWGIARRDPWQEHGSFNNVASLRLPSDTGIPWMFTTMVDNLSDPRDLIRGASRQDVPRIGFHGYSRGNMSQGGKWPGFRYWTETKKIDFRPLSWAEVQPCMKDYHRISSWRSHPEFIARLWINRPGEPIAAEQSQYGWIEVRPPEEGDDPWVEQVATTWKMVRDTLLKMNENMNLEWRFENK
ncbi:hypothetical protein FocTR4_00009299 [Fusarium oxysporum f. sp. cubense]|uniref:Uncharacterized protein n=1 Tax=Fusarium oxysporum f. sp. cubense TaxID=61366 RepID=A0A5C6SWI9_FUSOC|nr:hypothetical protein FocTR4_00009299 [Fusarium oxysporum f. sp. cubense]